MLRVLDLFSGIKVPSLMVDSAFDPKERGRSGKESKPFLGLCSCLIAKPHSADALACEQYQERGFPRMIDMPVEHRGSANKSVSNCRPGHVFPPREHSKQTLYLGSVCRTLIGCLWRFSQSKRQSNATYLPLRETQAGTQCHIDGSAVGLDRQPSFAASGTFLCIRASTILKLLCQLDTRSRISRSVLGVLP